MAKTTKKTEITAEPTALEKAVRVSYEPERTFTWNNIDVTVKRTLSFKEMVKFVNEVVNSCFTKEGAYNPEAKDFAFNLNVIEKYTNLEIPSGTEAQYEAVFCTNLVSVILSNVNKAQIDSIRAAIDEKIHHRAQANIEALTRQMTDLYASLSSMQEQMTTQFSALFDNVTAEDLTKLIGSMTDGKLDEKKIVEAYLEHSYAAAQEGESE